MVWGQIAGQVAGSVASKLLGGGQKSPEIQARQLAEQNYTAARINAELMPLQQVKGFEKAGIHKLYGFSGGSAQYSPSMAITSENNDTTGASMQRLGQNIGRAAEALVTQRERLNNRMIESQIEGQELENAKKASDLAVTTHAQTPGLNTNPIDHGGLMRNRDGTVSLVMSEKAKERLEEDILGTAEWNIRNRVPFAKKQIMDWLRLNQSADGRRNNQKRGFKKFTHAAKTLYNRYAN